MSAQATDLSAAPVRLADVLMGAEASLDDACGYCFDEADLLALSGPIDRIPERLLFKVAAEHPSHWFDFANLYRKLTPRIMALLVYGDLHIHVELIADRLLASGCWYVWADDERDAMLAVCHAWWDDTLSSYPSRPEAYEVLSLLATTLVPLMTWFAVWNSQPPGPADLHARDLCHWWLPDLLSGDLSLGWSSQVDITAELTHWILEKARPRLARVPTDPELTESLRLLEQGH